MKYKFVPVEPTEEMITAGDDCHQCLCGEAYTGRGLLAPDCPRHSMAAGSDEVYMAMVDAAPDPWTKVDDELPEQGHYLAWDGDCVSLSFWTGEEWWEYDGTGVITHFTPLPEGPQ